MYNEQFWKYSIAYKEGIECFHWKFFAIHNPHLHYGTPKDKISAPQMQKRRPFFTANISQIWLIGFGTNLMDKKNTALDEKANKGTFFKAHIPTSIINCVQLSIIPNSILSAIFEFEFCVHILEYFMCLNVFVFLIFFASLKLTQYCQQGVDTDIFVFSFLCVLKCQACADDFCIFDFVFVFVFVFHPS